MRPSPVCPVVRAYGAERATTAKVEGALDAQFDAEFRTARLGAGLFSSADLFAGTLTAAVVAVGVITGVADGTSAGTLLAFLFLLNLLVEPVQILVETLDQAQTAGAGLRTDPRGSRHPGGRGRPPRRGGPPEGGLDVGWRRSTTATPTG